ncbi:MAG TPA: proline racemase family protein [Solirubrobacteraceae bacterium]|nr:proline racemase family protein [Solirubrobacteraceae bacterium]
MLEVRTTDYHTAGEPFRIVTAGAPELPGATVRERREHARRSAAAETLRRLLCHEPRGHADMYGGLVVAPDDPGARLGVLFWHKDGWSTACGHGTIALGAWAVHTGLVDATADGDTEVAIDVPSGRVAARVRCAGGVVEAVTFRNVPAYVLARDVPVETSRGRLAVDVAYGGAIYATLPAAAAGLAVGPEHYAALIDLGREVKAALAGSPVARHPADDRLSGIYGTILFDDLGDTGAGPHQRNATVFADGEVDRSPCGSGTSARVALLAADGRLPPGAVLMHDSIVGTTFRARAVGHVSADGRDAVVSEVEGAAYQTGEHRFVLDPRDPVGTGFVLR